jgi:hypothetical protein
MHLRIARQRDAAQRARDEVLVLQVFETETLHARVFVGAQQGTVVTGQAALQTLFGPAIPDMDLAGLQCERSIQQ